MELSSDSIILITVGSVIVWLGLDLLWDLLKTFYKAFKTAVRDVNRGKRK